MNDPDLSSLERRLRTLPPLLTVPQDLVDRSLATAVDHPEPDAVARRRPWSIARVALVAGVLVALVATAALVLPGQTPYRHIATLAGAGNASGYVAVGPAHGTTEPVVVSVSHLTPAPAGSYYEITFETLGKPVPGAVFNVDSHGNASVRLNAPAHTRWVRCWVTRRSVDGTGRGTVVMKAAAEQTA